MNNLYIGIVIGLVSPIVGVFTKRLLWALPSLIWNSIKDYFNGLKAVAKVS